MWKVDLNKNTDCFLKEIVFVSLPFKEKIDFF